jgi:hypothetical protein
MLKIANPDGSTDGLIFDVHSSLSPLVLSYLYEELIIYPTRVS